MRTRDERGRIFSVARERKAANLRLIEPKRMNLKLLLAPVLLSVALPLCAAETTNAPAAAPDKADKPALAKIPDASQAPVRVTNTVTIAGEKVKYAAET